MKTKRGSTERKGNQVKMNGTLNEAGNLTPKLTVINTFSCISAKYGKIYAWPFHFYVFRPIVAISL